jgi:hypothetical protein
LPLKVTQSQMPKLLKQRRQNKTVKFCNFIFRRPSFASRWIAESKF